VRNIGGPNAWGRAHKIIAPDAQAEDKFGFGVAVWGKNAIVGAFAEDGGIGNPIPDAGSAYVFYVSLLNTFRAN
jgi:hypothetical protein